jgi:hypothetical protein
MKLIYVNNFFPPLLFKNVLPDLFRKSFFLGKASQVTQKSSHDLDFFENPKKVKVMTLTFLKIPRKSKS